MTRAGLFLLAVVMVAGPTSCGEIIKTDVDNPHDFSGNWSMTLVITANVDTPCLSTHAKLGFTAVGEFIVVQDGPSISAAFPEAGLQGTGAVHDHTFEIPMTSPGYEQGAAILIQGAAQGDRAASGTWKVACGGVVYDPAIATFTMNK